MKYSAWLRKVKRLIEGLYNTSFFSSMKTRYNFKADFTAGLTPYETLSLILHDYPKERIKWTQKIC